jgi:hypothetical protein
MNQYIAIIDGEEVNFSATDDDAAIAICMTNSRSEVIQILRQDKTLVASI